ncbi:MAG: hypothetical protein MUC65_04560 [Pontiellaceae bacterium]|jgi:hypothetical protein|nr:hypothetical protein [Pontiellaceae bacterium]
MERGRISQMKGRNHFNHQTWGNGRNRVIYVPRARVEDLQKAIDGYGQFMDLAEQYANEMIRLTRIELARRAKKRPNPEGALLTG